jgi:Dirigent-like protein
MLQAELQAYISLEEKISFSAEPDETLPPASVVAFDDAFYQATSSDPNDFGYEEPRLGTLRGTGISDHGQGASWTVVFRFDDDGSTFTAMGGLPIAKGRPGAGVLAIVGGTGRFRELRGELEVAVQNPHRWTVR